MLWRGLNERVVPNGYEELLYPIVNFVNAEHVESSLTHLLVGYNFLPSYLGYPMKTVQADEDMNDGY